MRDPIRESTGDTGQADEVRDVNASADASHWAAGWVIAREHRAQHASRIPREMLKV
jgi:hypothetical protein